MLSLLFGLFLCSSELADCAGFISSYSIRVPLIKQPVSAARCGNDTTDEIQRGTLAKATLARRDLLQKVATVAAIVTSKQNAVAAISTPPDAVTSSGPTTTSSAVCDPTVLSLSKGSRVLHIVGTAHVSSESADLAGRVVREAKPDAVFVELDATRLSRAFQGGIPPPGIRIALQDENGNLRLGVTQKTGLAERMLIKFVNAASNPSMYRKLEMSGIPVGEEVSV